MRSWIRYSTVATAAIAACHFAPGLGTDGGASIDAQPAADAGVCQTLGPACASEDTLRTCATVDQPPIDTACAWGCVGSDATAHCGMLVPSGGTATKSDLGSDGQLSDITLGADGDINGDDGTFGNLRDNGDKTNPYKNGVFWEVRPDNVAVFKVKSLNVSATLNVLGGHAIVIVATDSITINGSFDLHPKCNGNNTGFNAGPGGFTGADGMKDAMGSGAGKGGGGDGKLGGGGGGHGAAGGLGGAAGASTPAAAGPAFGDATITLLVGGGGGGGGGKGNGKGGGGGGAIQFVTNGTLTITAGGSVNAGGCGGGNGGNGEGGGGGGAGGTILLEAHDLAITGELAVNGGGGGTGDNGPDGSNSLITRVPAPGGQSTDDANADGGSGAAGAVFSGSVGGNGASTGGGAGGAVGRMRFNSRSGVVSPVDNAKLSPALDDPGSTTTQGRPRID
ncbi:hypothetical protein BH11MYX1_BH11MYX1_19140 [soil metagenome]